MKKLLVIAMAMAAAITVGAQTDPEYRAEIGGGVGLLSYQGDFNGSILANNQVAGGLVAKYRFNPRMALGLDITYGKLKGSSADVSTWYPGLQDSVVSFSNTLVDAGLRFEYNFWPYGTGREYFGAKRLTPYVAIGLGLTYAKAPSGSVVTGNLPIGVGVKYKVATRLNLALEWAIHFSLSDKLDGTDDPYGIDSSGMFKNTDSYSMLRLSLTYDVWAKCRTCHNDRF
uniref:type IX secretion system protein PorG n=1 Tax=Prevotella sp. TaxID=59823 RepID=UPI003FF0945D